jgi:hypothetical protein
MAGKFPRHLANRIAYLGLVLLVAGTGVLVGRSLAIGSTDVPPMIGELRPAPNVYVLPARSYVPPTELAKVVDAVGVIRVEEVVPVKDSGRTSDVTGVAMAWGRGLVQASVVRSISGDEESLRSFAFDAVFLPGTTQFGVSTVQPPLEVGVDYLVFIDHGRLVFPGGTYRVAQGKVWNIGHWEDSQSRRYPRDLSGLSVDAAAKALEGAAQP